jgi:SAM-dependent methyltransferase
MLVIGGTARQAAWRPLAAGAADASPVSEQDQWRLGRVRDQPGIMGDRRDGHRLATFPGGQPTARKAESMPTMQPGDAEQAMRRLGLGDEDVAAWHDSGLPEDAFTGWLTDRVARRPAGRRAREVYGAEDVHDFARRAIMDALRPGPGDHLLEVGCGGGLLLRDALAAGGAATGIDHSGEMTRLARQRAPGAGVVCAAAENLPFAGNTFSALAMSVVFFFLADPARVLRECRRVLRPGAPIAIYTTGPEMRGTPAAPEPLASLGHFYPDAELAELASQAGLANVQVRNDRGGQLLTAHS